MVEKHVLRVAEGTGMVSTSLPTGQTGRSDSEESSDSMSSTNALLNSLEAGDLTCICRSLQ